MDMNFDVNDVFRKRLASTLGLDKYDVIMNSVKNTDVSKDTEFQRVFNAFYVVRRNEEWRKVYYGYFERIKTEMPTFEGILKYLYEKTGNIEPSFASKMLATICPDKPIWDKYAGGYLELELRGSTKQKRLENAIELYAKMEKWYEDILQTDQARDRIKEFDDFIPDYAHISNTKKIDCILWSIR